MVRKSRSFVRKIFHGEDSEIRREGEGYTYVVMELDKNLFFNRIDEIRDRVSKRLGENVRIVDLSEENAGDFVEVYNRAILASPEPFRPITVEEALRLPRPGSFIAYYFGRPAGFLVCHIEGDSGIIAGIGVDPRFRRRGIASALALKATEFLMKMSVKRVLCDVYINNSDSILFVSQFGFKPTREKYVISVHES